MTINSLLLEVPTKPGAVAEPRFPGAEPDRAALCAAADELLAVDAAEAILAVAAPAEAGCRKERRLDALQALSVEEKQAREQMIADNLPLVRYVANSMARHAGQSILLDFEDITAYGIEGLIDAADSFDAGRGLKFSTWAVMHIRTTIQDALRTRDPLSRSLRARGKEIDRVSAELAHAAGSWPELTDVAAALGQPLAVLRRTLQDLGQVAVSLEQAEDGRNGAGDESGPGLLGVLADDDPEISPEATLDRRELSRLLLEAVSALPPREEVLIDAHYRQGQSMRTISQMLGISESRVSQLHARAVKLLREHMLQAA